MQALPTEISCVMLKGLELSEMPDPIVLAPGTVGPNLLAPPGQRAGDAAVLHVGVGQCWGIDAAILGHRCCNTGVSMLQCGSIDTAMLEH